MQAYPLRDPIAEYHRGEITFRKLQLMVAGLPPYNVADRNRIGNHWTDSDRLLANISNWTQVVHHAVVAANLPKGKAPPEFVPVNQPESNEPEEDEEDQQERDEMLADMRSQLRPTELPAPKQLILPPGVVDPRTE